MASLKKVNAFLSPTLFHRGHKKLDFRTIEDGVKMQHFSKKNQRATWGVKKEKKGREN